MKVYIGQLLCPKRHCFLALAGEYESPETAHRCLAFELGHATAKLKESGLLKFECALCGADEFGLDIQPTRFDTLKEAKPELQRLQAEQVMTRIMRGLETRN